MIRIPLATGGAEPTTAEMRRYYFYNFLVSLADTGNGNFTMVYFYFHGFSIMAILGAILTYGVTCLFILKPVGVLIERVGPENAFRLHIISEIAKYGALVSIFVFPAGGLMFFLLWQCANGFNVMLSRIPLTAYFSAYGDNRARGSQVGLTNNIQTITSVLVPVIAGALIQQTGIILITTIAFFVNVAATFILRFDGHVRIQNPVRFRRLLANVPSGFTGAFFVKTLPYPFAADLLSIYIAIALHSFAILGIFIGIRTAVTILLNYAAGRMTDAHTIRPFFFWSVLVSSIFWLVLPFVHDAWAIVTLQFTFGLAGLVTSIPFESAYHNVAKESAFPIEFAVWREVSIQMGLVLGTAAIMLVLASGLVPDWRALLPLGSVSALALLFALPYIRGAPEPGADIIKA